MKLPQLQKLIVSALEDIKGHDIEQFRTLGTQTVLYPPTLKSGELRYPYTSARN